MKEKLAAAGFLCALLTACGGGSDNDASAPAPVPPPAVPAPAPAPAAIEITSSSFADTGVIPVRYAAVAQGGSNISPALTIANVPTDTAYLAIVMDDDTLVARIGERR